MTLIAPFRQMIITREECRKTRRLSASTDLCSNRRLYGITSCDESGSAHPLAAGSAVERWLDGWCSFRCLLTVSGRLDDVL